MGGGEERAARATIVLRSREMTEMLAAAAGGAGLAVLPCLLNDAQPGLNRVTPQILERRTLSLIYRREAKVSTHIRAVIAFVVQVLRANADQISGERGGVVLSAR